MDSHGSFMDDYVPMEVLKARDVAYEAAKMTEAAAAQATEVQTPAV